MLTKAQEIERVAALRAIDSLQRSNENRFNRILRVAQHIFDVPIVSINLVDADQLFVKAALGMSVSTRPRRGSLCALAVQRSEPLIIEDGSHDPEFHDHPYIGEGQPLNFYAGAPISSPGGHNVGTLCLYDTRVHRLGPRKIELLRDLASWVERELAAAEELDRAAEVQRALLPHTIPVIPGYDIAGVCLPARQVGGDFFDWFFVDGTLQVVVADVMGKGIPAAIIAAGLRSVVRGASRYNDLPTAIERVALLANADLAETSTFVTLFSARLHPETHDFEYVDAGHGLAAIFDGHGDMRALRSEGMPLGPFPHQTWEPLHALIGPGETFISSSDGTLDCFDHPLEAQAAVTELVDRSSSAAEVLEGIRAFTRARPPDDDVTVVVIRRDDHG